MIHSSNHGSSFRNLILLVHIVGAHEEYRNLKWREYNRVSVLGAKKIVFCKAVRKTSSFAKWREKHRFLGFGTKSIVFLFFILLFEGEIVN